MSPKVDASCPIGIFDSGVGGLSVWREIARQFPAEDTIYLADQAHVPYGARSLAEVRRLSSAVAGFLLRQNVKSIVIACNTASAAALRGLRSAFPAVPFVGMEPAVKPACERTRTDTVAVIATPATFQGELFADLLQRYAVGVRVISQICPGLVEAVEAGTWDGPDVEALLGGCLDPLLEQGIDQLVLGCTHYAFLRPAIERIVGPRVDVIDPAPAVARQVGRVTPLATEARIGRHVFFTTWEPSALRAALERLAPAMSESPHILLDRLSVNGACWRDGRLDARGRG